MNDYTLLINREHPLPMDYIPADLVDSGIPFDAPPHDPKRLLESRTARAAASLFHAARKECLCLFGISGYRSYSRQKELYTGAPYVAPPGTSEHQSGLALDVSCPSLGLKLEEAFDTTSEGIWLHRNASLYGFIIRYPRNKEHITQIPYEPWHIRYVTKPVASYLSLTGLTLEEYHALNSQTR